MKINRRDKNLLIFTLIFCFFAYYTGHVFVPQYKKIHTLQEEIANKESIITDTAAVLNGIDGEISSSPSEITSVLDIVPNAKDTEFLLKSLDGVIAAGGMNQTGIGFGDESRCELPGYGNNKGAIKVKYNVVPVDIKLKGTYRQAINTMALLESQKRLFNYKSIDMTADQNGNINLSLSLEYYSMGKDAEAVTQETQGGGKDDPFQPIIKSEVHHKP